METAIRAFRVDVAPEELDDLHGRLIMTRLPGEETVDDWSQGLPLATARRFLDHWRDRYDWRRCEAMLNGWPQYLTEIDGLDIHFLHIRSAHAEARPLLMTHGWPGSVLEFRDVIAPLTDPERHGGRAQDAFHLILPSLPGYGFSGKPSEPGWTIERIAQAWTELMGRLGYQRWFAQGGDWGAFVTSEIGAQALVGCAGLHVNLPVVGAPPEGVRNDPTDQEKRALAHFAALRKQGMGYAEIQRTRPQTLSYALADSPVGQMAWIVEKFHDWTDAADDPDSIFPVDHLLDNVTLYWLTNSAASSARLYWESYGSGELPPIDIPSAVSIYPGEISQPSRRWVEERYRQLVHFEHMPRGGHFAAMQVSELFVADLRKGFAGMTL